MSTPNGADIPVGTDTPNGEHQPADNPAEEALASRLIERLASMGVLGGAGRTSAASQSAPQRQQASDGRDEETLPTDGNPWSADQWGQSWWTRGWESEWQPFEKEERPYISHLDFPKFDGKKESYPNYQYAVLNLKSQCAPKDYKYLAPKLIANFTGSMQEDARAMELLGQDFLVDDGVEQLLLFLWKRLHITDLNLETEAFEK